jgi:hypothetical protein
MAGIPTQELLDADLYKFNTCRIHLQVMTIADITEGNGECITLNAWNGVRAIPHNSRYKWAVQPRPPATFWSVWKRVLAQLCGRERRLIQPLGNWTDDGCEHWIWWYDASTETLFRCSDGISYRYLDKSARPTRLAQWRFNEQIFETAEVPASATPCTVVKQGQFLLFQGTSSRQNIPIPNRPLSFFHSFWEYLASESTNAWVFERIQTQGSLESIVQSIRTGTCSCVTDGSYKDHHGTAAWKIIDLEKPDHCVEGQLVSPGSPSQQDAYRSELSGLYASIAVINALAEYFQITDGAITLACDNISACRMSSYDAMGTNPSSCAHFDLVMAIQYIKTLKVSWTHKHVKGHQDDNPDHILTPIELVNVDMDTKAKHYWELTHQMSTADRIHVIDGQPWSITLGGHKVISNLAEQCKDWCQKPRIQEYWLDKGRFQQEEIPHIEFKTAGIALRREQPHTRRWVTKFASGYCGGNKWMHRWKKGILQLVHGVQIRSKTRNTCGCVKAKKAHRSGWRRSHLWISNCAGSRPIRF